ncbi:hypothetical protein JQK87_37055, partial [Streptomyces sp. G44]|nr:hypothetical protein [Streptomyces sp. G44]
MRPPRHIGRAWWGGGLALLVGALVCVLVAVAAGGPGVLERLAGQALGSRLEQAQRAAPGVVHSARFDPEDARLGTESDLGADLDRYAQAIENSTPRPLRGALVHDAHRVQLPTVRGAGSALSLVYASDAPGQEAYVAGRAPRARGKAVELAVSTRTRDALGLRLGQRVPLGAGALENVDAVGHVVGIYRAGGERRLWREQPLLARPLPGVAGAEMSAGALIAPRGAEVLQSQADAELTVHWNMRLVLDGTAAARFVDAPGGREFRRAMARHPLAARESSCRFGTYGGKLCVIGAHPATELETTTELPDHFEEFQRRWRQARVVISFASASLLGVGLAAVVVTSLLVVRRRLPADRLLRARGASAAAVGVEAVPVVVQCPGERAFPLSSSVSPQSPMTPARCSSHYFPMSVPAPGVSPRQWPGSMGPAGTKTAG